MPNKTTNLKLNKPLMNENVDINVLNENMDLIDAASEEFAKKPIVLNGTLVQGKTSLTLENPTIKDSSVFDIYVSMYGVNPVTITPSLGSVTLEFDPQAADLNVRVEVK